MRLFNFDVRAVGEAYEASVNLEWEERARAPARLYFRCSRPLSSDPEAYVNAFMVAASVPAMVFGEQRLTIDQPVCPLLRQNLNQALGWINHWFAFRADSLALDVQCRDTASERSGRRVGAFFSGGIDAWSTFLRNREAFPSSHPGAISEAIVVVGLQGSVSRTNFENAMAWFKPLSNDMQLQFTGVETNVYSHWMDLDPHYRIWSKSFNGASLSSIGHVLSHRLNRVLIASSDNMSNLEPWGTHPLLDPNYSSHSLSVIHDGVGSTRLDKTRMVADSELALNNLRVCDSPVPDGYLNCGTCEKCTRTMLTLESLGALQRCPTFPYRRLTREHLLAHGDMRVEFSDYLELVPGLQAQGRDDLLDGIQQLTRRWRQTDLRGWIKRADNFFLRGALQRHRAQQQAAARPVRLAPGSLHQAQKELH